MPNHLNKASIRTAWSVILIRAETTLSSKRDHTGNATNNISALLGILDRALNLNGSNRRYFNDDQQTPFTDHPTWSGATSSEGHNYALLKIQQLVTFKR